MPIRGIFCRIGNKFSLADKIIDMIPKHKIYIEPFFGSGVIFFSKQSAQLSIINDLDKQLMNDYKNLMKCSDNISDYPQILNMKDLHNVYESNSRIPEIRVVDCTEEI